jgi:nicotinate-nucleotide adenylyltransferase
MKKKQTVGILGGSFDPVHLGHLNLAISLRESCLLDEVFFIPARVSPFKGCAPPVASPEHRLAMLKLATSAVKEFRIIDWQLESQGPSYTIDVVRRLIEDSSLKLHLLLGEDHIASFHRWKQADELIHLASPLIGIRNSFDQSLPDAVFKAPHFKRVKIPVFEISSTVIRSRLAQKKYCGHLVPTSVLDYIRQYDLYNI